MAGVVDDRPAGTVIDMSVCLASFNGSSPDKSLTEEGRVWTCRLGDECRYGMEFNYG